MHGGTQKRVVSEPLSNKVFVMANRTILQQVMPLFAGCSIYFR